MSTRGRLRRERVIHIFTEFTKRKKKSSKKRKRKYYGYFLLINRPLIWGRSQYQYGRTLKELIEEKFGAGIMSTIDFTIDIEKVQNPKGKCVKVTMNGKFLPYKKW